MHGMFVHLALQVVLILAFSLSVYTTDHRPPPGLLSVFYDGQNCSDRYLFVVSRLKMLNSNDEICVFEHLASLLKDMIKSNRLVLEKLVALTERVRKIHKGYVELQVFVDVLFMRYV
ncbi:hypothetical protein HanXRQr2_Chr06g0243341 [Helianthus annuus]|uniref:Uncharacterized protein n=1 Tax=Helianthus annuus TaxID=4232 RepID=A0A251UFI1_HELAN|nr:hypothetical protein HanXRQr2_Chr06g0243341 [Helianthus annuus]